MIRLITKLDVKGPNLIKGISYEGNRVLGSADYFSELYSLEGSDEIFFQDSVASLYQRNNLLDILKKCATKVRIPITVAGGIRNLKNIRDLLKAGADKVAINTAGIKDPKFLQKATKFFGSQCIVASIEAKKKGKGLYEAWVDYGRQPTGLEVLKWCEMVMDYGVGEIIISSVDKDGTGEGFDINLIKKICKISSIPVVACSGGGKKEHFTELLKKTDCDAICAASIFHYYYIDKKKNKLINKKSKNLRFGSSDDIGNVEFVNFGYGKLKSIQVQPCSIKQLKKYLEKNKFKVGNS